MTGIRITVTDETIRATLARIDRVAANPAAIMSAIAGYMVTSTQRHFETETGPAGKWQPLSPRTAAKRVGRGRRGTANMLRVTKRLYSSVVGESSATEAQAGTNAIQAAIQHFGGTVKMPERAQDIHLSTGKGRKRFVKASAKRKTSRRVQIGAHSSTIPARAFLYLDEGDFAEIERIAADGFRQELGAP